MQIALGIDSAGPVVGVALWVQGQNEPAWVRSQRIVRGADAWLGPTIAEALALADRPDGPCRGKGITRVAVSTGPGAFTGLRVGVSLALGVAVARETPVVCLSSLLVRAAMHPGRMVLALLDAKKDRVYGGTFDTRGGQVKPCGPELDEPISAFFQYAQFCATGEGAIARSDELERAGISILPGATDTPAGMVAKLGVDSTELCSPKEARLRYIRLPDAKKPVKQSR